MRKSTVITIVVLAVLGVGTFVFLTNPFNGSAGIVRELSSQFMQDIQFKDFRQSSLYHHKLEKDRVDVGQSLEKLFLIKPEFLDIREYRVANVHVDSSGKRARVRVKTRFKRLNMKKEVEEGELMLYWLRRHPDCPIGAICEEEVCRNEAGERLYPRDLEEEKTLAKEDDAPPKPLACDSEAEDRWFMNLDSTLKEKKYNY